MENSTEAVNVPVISKDEARKIIRNFFRVFLALLFGYLHYRYVQHLHENWYHFSHLSELERELTLNTELGFYYSYYKTVVEEQPFIGGITKIMYDRLVEYPNVVNAFNTFHIYPEIMLGATYRYFEDMLNSTRVCHIVHRGAGMSPVESCVGIGEPIMFYLQAVWVLAGLLAAVMFLFATQLSGCILGGIMTVCQYFANHAESTRVMYYPNERENFAAPLLFLQMYLITLQLREDRKSKTSFRLQVSIFILNCICLLFWQFTQFVFLTQTLIFFVMEQLKIIDLKTLCVFLHSHFCGLHLALLLQGNDMLKVSIYTAFFLVVSSYCLFFSTLRIKVQTKLDLLGEIFLIIVRLLTVIIAAVHVKKILAEFFAVQDDNHIFEILDAKFFNFVNFHTLLYTCMDAYDFLPPSYVFSVSCTCVLPLAIFGVTNALTYWMVSALPAAFQHKFSKQAKDSKKRVKADKDKMAEQNKMAASKDGAKDSDTDDSGIENTETNSKNTFVGFQESKDFELPVVRFVYFLKNINIEPEVFYNVSQLVVFGVMAWIFMRLKLFLTTQLCIVSALAYNDKYGDAYPRANLKMRKGFLVLCFACLCAQAYNNITEEVSYKGEFSDMETERLVNWIKTDTSPNSVFAANLALTPTIMLTTRRAIVVHPHYENQGTRDRAYAVHKMYGRFSSQELYEGLKNLEVTHLIVDKAGCFRPSYGSKQPKENCGGHIDIWDAEMPSYAGGPQLCKTLLNKETNHFYQVYSSNSYVVFRIHDLSVQYMPRAFDT